VRVGIVAGETSGDQLAADLIRALHKINPNIIFEGIAGPQMLAAGCRALFAMEDIAVMGLFEVLKHLPKILKIRKQIIQYFLKNPPDVYIAVDAPDFNLTVERKFKAVGIPTVHYVSPTVWAWRRGRIKTLERSADLLLSILPFEKDFYKKYSNLRVEFVGHPLADQIPLSFFTSPLVGEVARRAGEGCVKTIALLPGSRSNEIEYLGELFLRTAVWCQQQQPNLSFIAPMVNSVRREQFLAIKQKVAPNLNIEIVDGNSRDVIARADAVLLASGTATLETMLLKKSMVVAYRMSPLTYFIAKKLIKTKFIALPNLLANKLLVPEFIQEQATVENLGNALLKCLVETRFIASLIEEFTELHKQMRCNASEQAAKVVLSLLPLAGEGAEGG
jgi:lipid-A-disaccharide synthase